MTSDPRPTNAPPTKETWGETHGHVAIQRLVQKLASEDAPELIKGDLVTLETLLKGHFEGEEAPGGWFEEMVEASPNNANQIASLKAEHVVICEKVDGLLELVNDLVALRKRFQGAKAEFVELINTHDEAEHKLTLDTLFVDHGGG